MTPFWFNNISVLYQKKYILEIIPHKNFDLNRKLNSLVRFSIYYSVILYLYNKNTNIFFIPFITFILSYLIQKKNSNQQINNLINNDNLNNETNNDCKLPTKDNPFMNPTFEDYNSQNLEACNSYDNKKVKKLIEQNFNEDLYRNQNDIFGKENSQRQFYTVPGSTIPNDQDSFVKWLYSTPKTCKEGNNLNCGIIGLTGSGSFGSKYSKGGKSYS